MNPSFIFAAVAAVIGSLIVGLPVGNFIVEHLPMGGPFGLKLMFAFALGGLWLLWVSHNTPTKNKSAVFAFGTYKVRMGPNRKGFTEGLNATPLGWPFFVARDKFAGEKTIPFNQTKAFSDDRIPVMLEGTYNSYIDDIYDTFNIENPEKALDSVVLKWVRACAEEFKAEQLISQEAGKHSSKIILAGEAYAKIEEELEDHAKSPWGYKITTALQINHIDLEDNYKTSIRKRQQEIIEGQYEQTQAERRRKQADELVKLGIRPDVAYAGSLVDAEKPGASLQNITIHGIEGLGPLADDLGALGRGLTDFAKSKAEPKGRQKK
ncbi:MAG: SPFH domain-containing protein [bacterium]|nr:SPFH domain-containing protein [bacterium]